MTCEMRLAPLPFSKIAAGKKVIELRLNDEKRQKIRVGDRIRFVCTEGEQICIATVKALHRFSTFEALYRALPLEACGYSPEEVSSASPGDMYAYYTPEAEAQYGVLGIELCRPEGGEILEKYCDLHTHSNCSDGTDSPEALISLAKAAGLSAVALCDHNTVAGLEPFEKAAERTGVIALPGVEVTCTFRGKEIHLLGLFIRPQVRGTLTEYLESTNRGKEEGNRKTVENLIAAGYHIDYESVKASALPAQPNRVHMAKILVQNGDFASVQQVFDGPLADNSPLYVPGKKKDALEAVSFLASLHILPVIAHPLLQLTEAELTDFVTRALPLGLVGLETVYPKYTPHQIAFAEGLAEKFCLARSGGSDYHGANKAGVFLGKGSNNIAVPFGFYEELRRRQKSEENPCH